MGLRTSLFFALAFVIGCNPSPAPGTPGLPTFTTAPTISAQPTATPTPSPIPLPTPVGREIDATKFTQRGGCGDTFLWAATQDNLTAITVEWQGAASQAWDDDGFDETAELPDGDIRVALVTGRQLSTIYCNDVLMPGAGSDAEVPAVSGEVSLVVRPDAGWLSAGEPCRPDLGTRRVRGESGQRHGDVATGQLRLGGRIRRLVRWVSRPSNKR